MHVPLEKRDAKAYKFRPNQIKAPPHENPHIPTRPNAKTSTKCRIPPAAVGRLYSTDSPFGELPDKPPDFSVFAPAKTEKIIFNTPLDKDFCL